MGKVGLYTDSVLTLYTSSTCNDKLQYFIKAVHLVYTATEIVKCTFSVHMNEHHECIPLAGRILFSLEVRLN